MKPVTEAKRLMNFYLAYVNNPRHRERKAYNQAKYEEWRQKWERLKDES